MRTLLALGLVSIMHLTPTLTSHAADTRCYEMRVYYAAPGKLEELHARFRNHTMKLFEKHGISNLGYWVPLENTENKLIYVLSYPSREARDSSWKAFMADPDWQRAYKASETNGKLVSKVETYFMTATDYSPPISAANSKPRVFELRTYTATAGKLEDLNRRFRDHTLGLFKKHGMENVAYWNLSQGEKNADATLIYLLAHKTKGAGEASFKSFREDPTWIKVKSDSEAKAGGSLTAPEGVKSVYMSATDYSPTQ